MLGISKAADYSILVVGYLSGVEVRQVRTKDEMAETLNLPADFLSKVLQKLVKSEIVESVKGLRGGYRLPRQPEDITLREVIEAIDGPPVMVSCLRENFKDCGRTQLCHPIIEKMREVEIKVSEMLENINFTELIPYIPDSNSNSNNSET